MSDQVEQDRLVSALILADVGDLIEDQEMVRVELFNRRRERQVAARDLKLLDEAAVVRVNRTRQPFSTRARPRAAAR